MTTTTFESLVMASMRDTSIGDDETESETEKEEEEEETKKKKRKRSTTTTTTTTKTKTKAKKKKKTEEEPKEKRGRIGMKEGKEEEEETKRPRSVSPQKMRKTKERRRRRRSPSPTTRRKISISTPTTPAKSTTRVERDVEMTEEKTKRRKGGIIETREKVDDGDDEDDEISVYSKLRAFTLTGTVVPPHRSPGKKFPTKSKPMELLTTLAGMERKFDPMESLKESLESIKEQRGEPIVEGESLDRKSVV